YEGRGAVRLIDADDEAGVLLLERCEPGTRLSQIEDDEVATAIAADVIRRLWKPVGAGHPFERVSDRARAWAASVPEAFERRGRAAARRSDQLVEARGLGRERIVGWAVAQSVELGLWSLSVGDRETGEWEIFCAEVLSQILG